MQRVCLFKPSQGRFEKSQARRSRIDLKQTAPLPGLITLAGLTRPPAAEWMVQMSRNVADEESGHLLSPRYLLHDRDTKFCPAFRNDLPIGSTPKSGPKYLCPCGRSAFAAKFVQGLASISPVSSGQKIGRGDAVGVDVLGVIDPDEFGVCFLQCRTSGFAAGLAQFIVDQGAEIEYSPSPSATLISTLPFSVNLTALPTRLVSTCAMRSPSTRTAGRSIGTLRSS